MLVYEYGCWGCDYDLVFVQCCESGSVQGNFGFVVIDVVNNEMVYWFVVDEVIMYGLD